jgi:hypothetical protein
MDTIFSKIAVVNGVVQNGNLHDEGTTGLIANFINFVEAFAGDNDVIKMVLIIILPLLVLIIVAAFAWWLIPKIIYTVQNAWMSFNDKRGQYQNSGYTPTHAPKSNNELDKVYELLREHRDCIKDVRKKIETLENASISTSRKSNEDYDFVRRIEYLEDDVKLLISGLTTLQRGQAAPRSESWTEPKPEPKPAQRTELEPLKTEPPEPSQKHNPVSLEPPKLDISQVMAEIISDYKSASAGNAGLDDRDDFIRKYNSRTFGLINRTESRNLDDFSLKMYAIEAPDTFMMAIHLTDFGDEYVILPAFFRVDNREQRRFKEDGIHTFYDISWIMQKPAIKELAQVRISHNGTIEEDSLRKGRMA